jgi:hypothetical protein
MATASKTLYRGAAPTSSTTLYTVPASTTAVVTSIAVSNANSVERAYTLILDDIAIATTVTVPGLDTVLIDLKQVLTTGKTIKGLATLADVQFHISGVEIS